MKRLWVFLVAFCLVGPQGQALADEVRAVFDAKEGRRTLEIRLTDGRVFVRGVDGDTVRVSARKLGGKEIEEKEPPDPRAAGLRKLTHRETGLEVWPEGNVMRVSTGAFAGKVEMLVEAPRDVSLDIKTTFGDSVVVRNMSSLVRVRASGGVRVENVPGEIDVETEGGWIYLDRVSGGVVANSKYGGIEGSFLALDPEKPVSLSATGPIDVSLPPEAEASLHMKSTWGDVYTDFDMSVGPELVMGKPLTQATQVRRSAVGKGTPKPQAAPDKRVVPEEKAAREKKAEATEAEGVELDESAESLARGSRIREEVLHYEKALGLAYARASFGRSTIVGKINGGGVEVRLTTATGHIYIRRSPRR